MSADVSNLREIPTPALVLDEVRLRRNIARMDAAVSAKGADLRPHMKTAKCVEVARLATAAWSGAITVSTLDEADAFAAKGFDHILHAVALSPGALPQARRLARRGVRLTVTVDSVEAVKALADSREAPDVGLAIEIDADGHRGGVRGEDPLMLAIASAARAAGLRLDGVFTHAGESYHCRDAEALKQAATAERNAVVAAAERLRRAGHACRMVSLGSTPTALAEADLTGVTEVRAGVYMFQDRMMQAVGVAEPADFALSVVATVIGRNAHTGRLILDAGWAALGQDPGPATAESEPSYGLLADLAGRPVPGLRLVDLNQEQGLAAAADPARLPALSIGERVRIFPNHACAMADRFGSYHVVRLDGDLTRWERVGRR